MNYTLPGLALDYGVPLAAVAGATMMENAGDDRLDRQLVRAGGNLAGGAAGYMLGSMGNNPNPYVRAAATAVGALGGGYISDRVADMVDPTQGRISPTELLNAHLENDPIAQQAMYQEKIRQARLMQREQQRQQMLQYQAQMAQQQGA